jgi:pyridoxine kinase
VEHVALAADTVALVKQSNSELTYLCDPILGDDPGGLYIDEDVASAIRDELIPLSNIATPNRFELEWLSGKSAKRTKTATPQARALGPSCMLVTSLAGEDPKNLVNLLIGEKGASVTSVTKRKNAPHGVGDLMAALFLGALLNGVSEQDALGRATGGVEAALEASKGADELQLATSTEWATAEPWPVEEVGKK